MPKGPVLTVQRYVFRLAEQRIRKFSVLFSVALCILFRGGGLRKSMQQKRACGKDCFVLSDKSENSGNVRPENIQ